MIVVAVSVEKLRSGVCRDKIALQLAVQAGIEMPDMKNTFTFR